MWRYLGTVLIGLALAGPAAAQSPRPASEGADYDGRIVGNWLTAGKFDRFGDGGSFMAFTVDTDGLGFGVRCLQRELTLAVLNGGADPKPLDKGELFSIKLRVDGQPVVETKGVAINGRVIQVDTQKSWVKALRDGREAAVRVENSVGVYSTHIYKMAGARRAFADIVKECPID